jgi:hypothetical protein
MGCRDDTELGLERTQGANSERPWSSAPTEDQAGRDGPGFLKDPGRDQSRVILTTGLIGAHRVRVGPDWSPNMLSRSPR